MTEMELQKAPLAQENAPGWCMALALLYLAGPLMIMGEILKPVFWIPAFLLFLPWLRSFDLFLFPGRAGAGGQRPWIRLPPARHLGLGAVLLIYAALWIFCSGIGSFTLCRYDYVKHNLIFSSLLQSHLPIMADFGDGRLAIVHYYFAYYIVPVRVFQALHLLIGQLRLELVTFAIYGLALFGSLRVLASSLRVPALALLGIMAFAGGLDIVGHVLFGVPEATTGQIPFLGIPIYVDLDWWGVPPAPQSLTLNLFWAPQHFFAAIIGVAVICCIFSLQRPAIAKLLHASCIIVAGAFWSPYVAVGLAVVTLGAIGGAIFPATFALSKGGGGQRIVTPAFLGAVGFFLLLLAFMAAFFAAAAPTSPPGVIFAKASPGDWALSFTLRLAPALVVLVALGLRWSRSATGPGKSAARELLGTVGFLLVADAVLLCFIHGTFNDWAMRTTLPISILLAAVLCRFLGGHHSLAAKITLVVLLALSSASSLNEVAQSIFLPRYCAAYGSYAWRILGPLAGQYEGRSDSLLYRWLARQPEARPF